MRARRVAAAVVGAAAVLLVGPAAAARGDEEVPGSQDLELKVGRLEREQQADVVGAEASAMLFAPADTRALGAAAQSRAVARQAETAALFLSPPIASRVPITSDVLFGQDAYTGGRAARDGTTEDADDPGPWGAAGAGGALLVGGGLSYIAREQRGNRRG